MRIVVLVLLLANIAVLAWARYGPDPSAIESQLVAQQIRPDEIRLLSPEQVAALSKKKERVEPEKATTCVEWGAFNAADVARAHGAIDPLVGAERVSERQVEEAAGWWVFMPPQTSRAAANEKIGQLKRLGVEDFFIVQEDPKLRFAISLGVFRTEEAARARLDQLREKGVKTAEVGPRQAPVQKVYLQLRGVPEGLQPKLAELREGFPGTQITDCAR